MILNCISICSCHEQIEALSSARSYTVWQSITRRLLNLARSSTFPQEVKVSHPLAHDQQPGCYFGQSLSDRFSSERCWQVWWCWGMSPAVLFNISSSNRVHDSIMKTGQNLALSSRDSTWILCCVLFIRTSLYSRAADAWERWLWTGAVNLGWKYVYKASGSWKTRFALLPCTV